MYQMGASNSESHQDGSSTRENRNAFAPWESWFDERIVQFERELIAIRRHLHSRPEPSGEEVETSRYVAERLRRAELNPRVCRNELGVVVDVTLGRPPADAPLIAVRADMDALRIPDRKRVEYASQVPTVGHLCGHDAHTAMVLGTALAGLAGDGSPALPAENGLRLRLLFQPAEETSEGAEWLIDQGALDGVAAILGLHVDPERTIGEVGIRYGVLTANCDEVTITVEGRGGHAARPHHAVDPVAASAHLISTLYEFLPRSVDSRNASVFTVGNISGGFAPNVIPDRVELHGTLRTTDPQSRERLKERLQAICAAAGQTCGATVRVEFSRPLQAVVNDAHVTEALEQASRRVVGPENIIFIDRPSMGGEDFAMYLDHVPGAMLRLGCGGAGGDSPFLHSPFFDIDERALALGTRILLRSALWLTLHPPARSGAASHVDA